jgi:hypothetical protein
VLLVLGIRPVPNLAPRVERPVAHELRPAVRHDERVSAGHDADPLRGAAVREPVGEEVGKILLVEDRRPPRDLE